MIKKIYINNFKSIQNLEINCNPNFNIIMGENNMGKTTIFEAIRLWKLCYDKNIKTKKNGFYSNPRNIAFHEMEFLRVFDDSDLITYGSDSRDITISLTIELNGTSYTLGFIITKVLTINDAYVQIEYLDKFAFNNFSDAVSEISDYNLTTIISINESKPIANIITKEPYMYKAQVKEKISKGKGYEVLRNKIISSESHKLKVQEHLENVFEKSFTITEVDKERTYIRLNVNGTDILSQGSGFLQIAEIFSSFEYAGSLIYILLIDEPDSHLHQKLQKKLIEEFRTLNNCQLFIITHNDRYLNDSSSGELYFLNKESKDSGILEPLPDDNKYIVVNNMTGILDYISTLQYATKIVLLEGSADKEFFDRIIPIYCEKEAVNIPNVYYALMDGIDSLQEKLFSYSRALKDIVPLNCNWIIIRDTDCAPLNKRITVQNEILSSFPVANKQLLFQQGYGIESTFISEKDKLTNLVKKYYNLCNEANINNTIEEILSQLNAEYYSKVCNVLDPIHQEFKKHFDRQKTNRREKIYKKIEFNDTLSQITPENIEYIMTKKILDLYLESLHDALATSYTLTKPKLNHTTIFSAYYDLINSIDDFYNCHLNLIQLLY
jgi:predicted ATP-dependent endonuclease of OLD family